MRGGIKAVIGNAVVMPGFMPGIHALKRESDQRRGWPGRLREDALRALARQ
jgi:hypothetical protein